MATAPATTTASGPAGLPVAGVSACAKHREWIEAQVQLGRNAVSIYQDLVETHGFTHRYNSVKRFVRKLRAREPERFDVLEFEPGEEAQVDFGLGAPTLYRKGRYKRPWLFVMTLKYSGKSFRTTAWKADQETWARLHELAFQAFGGCVRYAVLDNLKVGVARPDLYEPELNPLYTALLDHYHVVADPCRIQDPNRKGTVENAIQHTQATALKGKRFESIEAQNAWLAHWEERWAAPRIHGRKKRQVLEMFREERPHLQPLPTTRFRYFTQGKRTVDDAGLVQVDGSYYAALPAPLYSEVTVRIYDREIEILDRVYFPHSLGILYTAICQFIGYGKYGDEGKVMGLAPYGELAHMDRTDAKRIIHALEAFAADGRGDVKALKGALKGRYRLRIGKWRVFFSLDQPGNVVVTDVDNRGQAY
jgi:transposase/mRNA-degrading endonuclease RelE of RelBE toxin-antitoxin system